MSTILILPNEILLIIINNTPIKELSHLSATSRFFHAIIDPILMRLAQQDYRGIPALHWAAKYGYASLIPRLLALGHDVDSEKTTTGERIDAPIIYAARHRRLSAANILLLHGADPNVAGANGPTALPTTNTLLFYVADTNAVGANGCTALLWAAYNNDLSMTITLLKHGAHVNPKCVGYLGTPLYTSLLNSLPNRGSGQDVAEELLRAGAEIDFVDSTGNTALHYTCDSDHKLGAVKWLISKGASINNINNYGWTPLDMAIDWYAYSVVSLLRENGGIEWRMRV